MSEQVTAKIFRFDPSKDEKPRYETYVVPKEERMIVGDVLNYIYENYDGSLAYRWECRSRGCGTCTVIVNGQPALICKEPVTEKMIIEPLPFLPVIRDLVVERNTLLERISSIPGLTRAYPPKKQPEPIDPTTSEELGIPAECCLCFACVAVCPLVRELGSDLLGPVELLRIGKFALDSRDGSDRVSQSIEKAVFDCVSCYRCVDVCPHEINAPDTVIAALKRKCNSAGIGRGTKHTKAFVQLIEDKGMVKGSRLFLKTWGPLGFLSSPIWAAKVILKRKATVPIQKPIGKFDEVRRIFELKR